jgi:hypothetical protein
MIELDDHGKENQATRSAYLGRSDQCAGGFEQA